ncbi:AraC family transcriptional regulator [Candidatus Saccharibacteria bacterium]|nr:MAG: AraC family transcriptional regulator [Candidatus Saccharibacteria bacterium]
MKTTQAPDIEKIVRYIRDNVDRDITLDDISKHASYSKYHLSREFKKQTGCSIKQYIEAIRIEKGIEKIMDDQGSITRVAFDVGHKSPGTFSSTFKSQTKLSPKKYHSESTRAYKFLTKWIKKNDVLVHNESSAKTGNSVSVRVIYPPRHAHKITCVGLFRTAIPKGEPVVGVATTDKLEITLDNVPNGRYYLLACEILEDLTVLKNYNLDKNHRQAILSPITFSGNSRHCFDLTMRKPIDSDPPITINVPAMLMRSFAIKSKKNRNS